MPHALLGLLALASAAHAAPHTFTHQGRLLDASGAPRSGTAELSFHLYPSLESGSAVWSEVHTVSLADGYYTVDLGAILDPTPYLDGGTAYLETRVAGAPLTPRTPVLSVPYAVHAGRAEGLVRGAETVTADDLLEIVCVEVLGRMWDGASCAPSVYARPITVSTGASAVPAGSTLFVTFDHAFAVALGKSEPSGQDVRVVYDDGSETGLEVHRVNRSAWNTSATELAFRVPADIPANTSRTFYLTYGPGNSGAPLDDPRQVYLLYDDFSDGDYTNNPTWSVAHGAWSVVEGALVQARITSGDAAEVGAYYAPGLSWTDITAEMRVYDAYQGSGGSYPGPMMRVANVGGGSTSAWWFEYYTNHTGSQAGTMRPFVGNTDYSWVYTFTGTAILPNTWHQLKYTVIGDTFQSWVDGVQRHALTTAQSAHRISAGTVALSMHSNSATNGVRWDDIIVYRAFSAPPSVALGSEL